MAEDDTAPPSEADTVYRREDDLATGTRSGSDRRGDERGLAVGRRLVDQQTSRQSFIARVLEMSLEGASPMVIANFLNEEEFTTARGAHWTPAAIEQLIATEEARRERDAWRPPALDEKTD